MASKERAAVSNGLTDILGNVIQADRRQSGRGEEPTPSDTMTNVTAIEEANNNTIGHYDNNTVGQTDNNTNTLPTSRKRTTRKEASQERPLLERRTEEAKAMAETPTMTVTLRIPTAFNDWLDEYLHGSYPVKIKKQELVVEALQLVYARRGKPKEEILETELLPSND